MGSISLVLYIGVTSDLEGRIWDHKNDILEGFTKRYQCHKLIYFEVYDRIEDAISREKQLKNWHREWKLNLIRKQNPKFQDRYDQLFE